MFLVVTAMTSRAQMHWKDAPVSISIGATYNSLDGDAFGNYKGWMGLAFDISYKYIYTGYAFSPKQNVLNDVWDANSFQFNLGSSIPFQISQKNILTVTPYVSLSDVTYFGATESNKSRWQGYFGVGPGVKASISLSEKINIGLQFTKIFITDDNAPDGWTSVGATIGFNL